MEGNKINVGHNKQEKKGSENVAGELAHDSGHLGPRIMEAATAPPASIFKAVVSYAESPSSFFLVPEFDLRCACSGIGSAADHQNQNTDAFIFTSNDRELKCTGVQGYNNVVKELSRIMAVTRLSRLWNKSKVKELVAFNANSGKASGNGHPLWLRGIISNSADYSNEKDKKKCSAAEVFLFDSGHKLTTNTIHISQLPDKYSKIPPFAVRCSLYGIQPTKKPSKNEVRGLSQVAQCNDVSGIGWSPQAIVDFQKLVKSPEDLMKTGELQAKNLVVVEVKKSPSTGKTDAVFRTDTNTPYSVMITVPSCESGGRGINVSEEMVKLGHGDYTNLNPGFSFAEWEFLKPFSSLP